MGKTPMTSATSGGLGEALRHRRLQKNLTVEIVGQETHIHPRFLRALEEEKWEEFPARVYLQGFLRQYGNYLGLDGEELVGQLRRAMGQVEKPAFVRKDSAKNVDIEKAGMPLGTKALLTSLAVMLAAVYFFISQERRSSLSGSQTPVQESQSFPGMENQKSHDFIIRVKGTVWLRTWVDDRVRFEGTLQNGMSKSWTGLSSLRVQTTDMSLLDVQVDGKSILSVSEKAPGEIFWPSDKDRAGVPEAPPASSAPETPAPPVPVRSAVPRPSASRPANGTVPAKPATAPAQPKQILKPLVPQSGKPADPSNPSSPPAAQPENVTW
jgi:hypothetical protein